MASCRDDVVEDEEEEDESMNRWTREQEVFRCVALEQANFYATGENSKETYEQGLGAKGFGKWEVEPDKVHVYRVYRVLDAMTFAPFQYDAQLEISCPPYISVRA
jgi:hypothetical protein